MSDTEHVFNVVAELGSEVANRIATSRYKAHLKPFVINKHFEFKHDKVIKYCEWKLAGCPRFVDSVAC